MLLERFVSWAKNAKKNKYRYGDYLDDCSSKLQEQGITLHSELYMQYMSEVRKIWKKYNPQSNSKI